jgi:diguanylate cyclase (GGDEF)-like protein
MVDDIFLIEEATVGRTQFRLAAAVAGILVIAGIAATPFADTPLLALPTYMTAFGAAMIVTNLLLAALLFSKWTLGRQGDAARLGDAYLFVALIFIPFVATFPGALKTDTVIGTRTSAVWLWIFWHAGFGLAIIRYVASLSRNDASPPPVKISIIAIPVIVIFLTICATLWQSYLPPVLDNNGKSFFPGYLIIPVMVLIINVIALLMVARLHAHTPEQLWLAVGMVAACLDIWLSLHGGNRYTLGWYCAKVGSMLTSLLVLISNFHGLTVLYENVASANNLLQSIANKDGLTGLLNRRSFDEIISKEWQRAQREGNPLALLMIDIDFFKAYNDCYGHLQGDDCLRKVAQQMQAAMRRPGDVVCRYGGEEFAVILPNTGSGGASRVAQSILSDIAALALPHAQNSPHQVVSASIGVASVIPNPDLSISDLIATSDRALYQAKAAGRNQMQVGDCKVLEKLAQAVG